MERDYLITWRDYNPTREHEVDELLPMSRMQALKRLLRAEPDEPLSFWAALWMLLKGERP